MEFGLLPGGRPCFFAQIMMESQQQKYQIQFPVDGGPVTLVNNVIGQADPVEGLVYLLFTQSPPPIHLEEVSDVHTIKSIPVARVALTLNKAKSVLALLQKQIAAIESYEEGDSND